MTATKPACRTSDPIFLKREYKLCGSCLMCECEDVYNPNRTGTCRMWEHKVVKLTAKKECWR